MEVHVVDVKVNHVLLYGSGFSGTPRITGRRDGSCTPKILYLLVHLQALFLIFSSCCCLIVLIVCLLSSFLIKELSVHHFLEVLGTFESTGSLLADPCFPCSIYSDPVAIRLGLRWPSWMMGTLGTPTENGPILVIYSANDAGYVLKFWLILALHLFDYSLSFSIMFLAINYFINGPPNIWYMLNSSRYLIFTIKGLILTLFQDVFPRHFLSYYGGFSHFRVNLIWELHVNSLTQHTTGLNVDNIITWTTHTLHNTLHSHNFYDINCD